MKRGEIWTLQDDKYASKARPVIIIQSDDINSFNSIILCLFTTFDSSKIATRVHITANSTNGLNKDSYIMTDKIITVDKRELGERIGVLTDTQMKTIANQLAIVLGI